ncbi:MAG: AAA family ATPase [Porphyromonadaceae bacterium]|nr:AAA family ATPase [Porphyromonadaceae bacterium]
MFSTSEHDANIIYINKEDIAYVDIVSSEDLHDYIASRLMSKRKNYIFIDEIQEIEDFKVAVRSLALDDRNDIYITGSNSEMFSSDLANELGTLFSSKSISDFLKSQNIRMSPTLVSEYADSLVSAFVVHRLGRYDIVGKRLFERGEKYFFENMGIRNVVAGYKPQDRAKRLENIVREFGNLLKIKDNYPKIVVSGERSFENTYEGIEHIYIRDFLTSSVTPKIV